MDATHPGKGSPPRDRPGGTPSWIQPRRLGLRSRYNGSNNGKLALSVHQGAELLGMSKSTVTGSFTELEAKGFIVKTKQGQWYGRQTTEWRVTDQSCNGHQY